MERPVSGMANASSRPTTDSSSNLHHQRSGSKKIELRTWSPTAVLLFVKNLQWLNLDHLPDWPAITPASLGNQDARIRIRCTEWALYQLFRLYDASMTTEKLQPFFPPLEPLQSINLRAALYRCLNELKKGGVLGRDTVLRKSMLDDCQGDKFWELCLVLSGVVLRKTNCDHVHAGSGRPLAERIATAQPPSKIQKESMLPLAIAHKVALTKILAEKERKKRKYSRLSVVLLESEAGLQQRKLRAQQRSSNLPSGNLLDRIQAAQDALNKQWSGNKNVRDALINGDEPTRGDSILSQPFENVWEDDDQDRSSSTEPAEAGLLEDLEYRMKQQRQRLRKWQNFHDKLTSLTMRGLNEVMPTRKDSVVRFDQHQDLHVGQPMDVTATPTQPNTPSVNAAKYDEILTAMREELRIKSRARNTSQPQPVPRARRPSYRPQSIPQTTSPIAYDSSERSPSQTAVPVRPGLGRRMSSRPRSYQLPKVVSQREPIPLKTEIFSPLKTRRSSASPASATSIYTLPSEEEHSPKHKMDGRVNAKKTHTWHHGDGRGHSDSGVGLGIEPPNTQSESQPDSPKLSRPSGDHPDSGIELPPMGSSSSRSSKDLSSATVRPSLAERTRMSMAFTHSDEVNGVLQEESPSSSHDAFDLGQSHDSPSSASSSSDPSLTQKIPTSLVDRTRNSISLAPQPVHHPTAKQSRPPLSSNHSRSRTSIYHPTDQFSTPTRNQPSASLDPDPQPRSARRDVTPREKLFESDADYDSVFRARPRVALSPVPSPSMSVDVDDDHSSADHDLIDEDPAPPSSPLAYRG